jgi:hypothetical protein
MLIDVFPINVAVPLITYGVPSGFILGIFAHAAWISACVITKNSAEEEGPSGDRTKTYQRSFEPPLLDET